PRPRIELRLQLDDSLGAQRLAVPIADPCARRRDHEQRACVHERPDMDHRWPRPRPPRAAVGSNARSSGGLSPTPSLPPATRSVDRSARLGLPRLSGLPRLRAAALVAGCNHVLRTVQRSVLIRIGGIEIETFYRRRLGSTDLPV